jgi:glycosyltransferase involved in cell wall biosynthesis
MGYLRRAWDVVRAGQFDAVYVHLWVVPFGPPWFEEWLARRGIPLIYDIDDLIYLPKASHANAFLARWRKNATSIARMMHVAKHVIVCTQYLERFAKQHNPAVTCISSTINTEVYRPRQHSRATRGVTIGWSGSHSTSAYLHELAPVLRELSRRFAIRLLVVGDVRFRMEGVNVEARPWCLARETADLAEMDIGVYPLPHEEWVLGKSGLKALQYMGMGIPVVASAIGEVCRVVRDGDNGFLVHTPEEWIDRVRELIEDPDRRVAMGLAGRLTVEQSFSVKVTAPIYQQVLDSVLGPVMEPSKPPVSESLQPVTMVREPCRSP